LCRHEFTPTRQLGCAPLLVRRKPFSRRQLRFNKLASGQPKLSPALVFSSELLPKEELDRLKLEILQTDYVDLMDDSSSAASMTLTSNTTTTTSTTTTQWPKTSDTRHADQSTVDSEMFEFEDDQVGVYLLIRHFGRKVSGQKIYVFL
jgi:hypothetical protein